MVIESLRRAIRDIHTPHTHTHTTKQTPTRDETRARETHARVFLPLFTPVRDSEWRNTHSHTQHICKVQLAILRNVVGLKNF